MTDRDLMKDSAGARLALIADSFARLTGQPLIGEGQDIWSAPAAVVAHGTQDPPLFFYANRTALGLFRMTAAKFIGLPSYRSAEAAHRAERAAMFEQLHADDVVTGYSGMRVAADGTRFRIEDGVVWNLVDANGTRHGQAAAFARWTQM